MDTSSHENKDPQEAACFLTKGEFRIQHPVEAHTLASFLAQACPDPRSTIVGITEILLNAIEHGNLKIGFDEKSKLQKENSWMKEIEHRLSLPEHKDQYVEIEFSRTNSEIQIKVTDQGDGFDWKQYEEPDPKNMLASHGRGILMAKALAFKSVEYSDKGNVVTCRISLT